MIKNKIVWSICCCLFLVCTQLSAQPRFTAKLSDVPATGFYRILLKADVLGECNASLADIRIIDEKKQQVPYIIGSNEQEYKQDTAIELRFSSKKDTAGNSVLLLENTASITIRQLQLLVKTNSVTRYASISGSNNQKDWYIINNNLVLTNPATSNKETSSYLLSIPATNYQWLSLTIDNHHEDALNILKISVRQSLDTRKNKGHLLQAFSSFKRKDTVGKTIIDLQSATNVPAELLKLAVKSPKFFNRRVVIYGCDTGNYFDEIAQGFVASKETLNISFSLQQRKQYRIVIENGDNPPLGIDTLYLGYCPRTITVYAEKGSRYQLQFGDADALPPHYDLESFRKDIDYNTPTMAYLQPELVKNKTDAALAKKKPSNYWIWLSLLAALGVMSFITLRLLKEMKQSGK